VLSPESRPPGSHSALSTQDSALDWLDALQAAGIRPGLARMRKLLRALGNPHRRFASIIVAGTNGKGSTSAMLESIVRASGYRTALYTSPHLVDMRERWLIDGAMISRIALERAIEQLRGGADRSGITPTYFEALTLIAFIAFAEAKCEVAVLEVGMGGRLDATNVVRPIAAVITPIGLDHTEFLGNTVRRIAREKAGVIHRGAVVVTSSDDPVVVDVLRKRAEKFSCPFHVVDGEHAAPLAGDFQRRNAALAARAASELRGVLPNITQESIERGIANTQWRGRLEHVVVDGHDVWIDGGHNAHAIRAVVPFIEAHIPAPRTLVFGIMRDKDVQEVIAILFPLFDQIIATDPYAPRSVPPHELPGAVAEPNPATAIERALASGHRSIVIAGSLYLAGAAIEFLDAKRDQQSDDQQR
jgi:dihydrofolate synthase/folylpolyglutamate synthase